MSKNLIITAVIAIVVLAVLISYPKFLPQDKGSVKQKDETADLSRDEVLRDWKTYRNEEFGFEFRYPSELIISSPEDNLVLWRFPDESGYSPSSLSLQIKSRESGEEDIYSYVKNNVDGIGREMPIRSNERIIEVQLGSLQRTELGLEYVPLKVFDFENGGYFDEIYFFTDSKVVSLSSRLSWQPYEIPGATLKILSTFKFTK